MKSKAIFLLLLFVSIESLNAQYITQIRPNYFKAGIPEAEFQFFSAPNQIGKQRQENWCWAACIQMILNYHGLIVTQEDVVYKVFGDVDDHRATDQEILSALDSWAFNLQGGMSKVYYQAGVNSPNEVVNLLAAKWPLLVGIKEADSSKHTYVMTDVFYSVDRLNNTYPDKVVLRDPWPGTSNSTIIMSWDELVKKCSLVVKIWVSR
jgi:hypothetical protein